MRFSKPQHFFKKLFLGCSKPLKIRNDKRKKSEQSPVYRMFIKMHLYDNKEAKDLFSEQLPLID